MTFRTRTVEKRNRRRSSHSSDARRTLLLNLAFVFAIAGALAILGGVVFANWYSDHWAPVASVDGQRISKDDVRARAAVLKARYQQQKNQVTQLLNKNLITSDQASTQQSNIDSSMADSSVNSEALTELQTEIVLKQYADKHGISVTDAQVQAQLDKDATTPEQRNVKVIAVTPVAADGQTTPTQADIDAAKTKAQGFLDKIKGGAKWDDVATEANVDYQAAPSGAIGLVTKDNSTMDPELTNDVFGLKGANDITPIVKSPDGIFRFATITAIVPESKASNRTQAIQDSGASGDAYKAWAHGQALRDDVKTQFTKTNVDGAIAQRHVLDIFVPASSSSGGDEVKARLIVFAPNKDPQNAANVAKTDAAWTDAKKRADEAYAKVKDGNVDTFKTEAKTGDYKQIADLQGELPYFGESIYSDAQQGLNMAEVGTELFKDGLKLEQVLPPVQTNEGWVIAQFAGRRADATTRMLQAQLQVNSGADFSSVAKSISQSADAPNGGDMGWVAKYQMDPALEQAIFQTPVGSVSSVVTTQNGSYLFKVVAEATQPVTDQVQKATLDANAFNNWLAELQGKASVWQDSNGLDSLSASASAS